MAKTAANIRSLSSRASLQDVIKALADIKAVLRGADADFTSKVATAVEAIGVGSSDATVYPTPAVITGFTATGGFNSIILTGDRPTDEGFAYIEIYRNSEDNLATAVMVRRQQFFPIADTPPDTSLSATYYYWARSVNQSGVPGPFNATGGTQASTADEPDYILQLLQDAKWQTLTAYPVGERISPTRDPSKVFICTIGGTSGASEPDWPDVVGNTIADGTATWQYEQEVSLDGIFEWGLVGGVVKAVFKALLIGDATITNAKIANLAVDDAKIADLSVAKLLAGIIKVSNIFLGNQQRVHLDGINNRILVSDGTRNRVILGQLGAGWGIEIYDASGNVILNSGGVSASMVAGLGNLALIDQITAANIGTYMGSAAITDAYIANASVSTLKIQGQAVTVPVSTSRTSDIAVTNSIVMGDLTTLLTTPYMLLYVPGVTATVHVQIHLTLEGSILGAEDTDWDIDVYLYRQSNSGAETLIWTGRGDYVIHDITFSAGTSDNPPVDSTYQHARYIVRGHTSDRCTVKIGSSVLALGTKGR